MSMGRLINDLGMRLRFIVESALHMYYVYINQYIVTIYCYSHVQCCLHEVDSFFEYNFLDFARIRRTVDTAVFMVTNI